MTKNDLQLAIFEIIKEHTYVLQGGFIDGRGNGTDQSVAGANAAAMHIVTFLERLTKENYNAS